MKLEVGMYARTFEGKIFKIQDLKDELIYVSNTECYFYKSLYGGDYCFRFPNENNHYTITKASHNIIDLIEVGDYVNGCYVSNKRASVNEHLGGHPKGIGIIKCNAYFNQGNYDDCNFKWIEAKDIKSIVTKEQFESMAYKVGE